MKQRFSLTQWLSFKATTQFWKAIQFKSNESVSKQRLSFKATTQFWSNNLVLKRQWVGVKAANKFENKTKSFIQEILMNFTVPGAWSSKLAISTYNQFLLRDLTLNSSIFPYLLLYHDSLIFFSIFPSSLHSHFHICTSTPTKNCKHSQDSRRWVNKTNFTSFIDTILVFLLFPLIEYERWQGIHVLCQMSA